MTYNEAVDYINLSYKPGRKHEMDVFQSFMNKLGNPQDELKIIHVAGTNGKGSTCAMLQNILTESGYKTGMFTSPHLSKRNERFVIDGEMISDDDFAVYVTKVKSNSEAFFTDENEMFSFFEILTAVCFLYFRDKKVDYLILEVGIGGRIDCTNIIQNPVLSIICSISLDHVQKLGHTIEEIAIEKAGIIKNNSNLVLYSQPDYVYNIINEICVEKNTRLYYSYDDELIIKQNNVEGLIFSIKNNMYDYNDINIKLSGEYQIYNVKTVLMAVHALQNIGINISESAVLNGLRKTKWPGRFEKIDDNPLFIVDGAHNDGATSMLSETIRKYFSGKKITLLTTVLSDKDYKNVINNLSGSCHKIVITLPLYKSRATCTYDLYNAVSDKSKMIVTEQNLDRAIQTARKITNKSDVIICSGSLFLVGDVRDIILGKI